MLVFLCNVCQTPLSAPPGQTGQLVRCPSCLSVQRVPADAQSRPDAPRAPRPGPTLMGNLKVGGRRYGFSCAYCSSRLEATEAMGGQDGQCPTCGNNITIPILDRYGRLIDPHTREVIKQDPHPVHAYAAAGERAPQIVRTEGKTFIQCPRCRAQSPITANNCKDCGLPFTMEGTSPEISAAANNYCVAALVLGIIGLPASCTLIVPLLAILFGALGYVQAGRNADKTGRGMAIAGMVCGGIGLLLFLGMALG